MALPTTLNDRWFALLGIEQGSSGIPGLPTVMYDSAGNALEITQEVIDLVSATRTANTSVDLINPGFRGVIFFLDVTAASGTGGVKLNVQAKAPGSGNLPTGLLHASTTLRTATGVYFYTIGQGAGTTTGAEVNIGTLLPRSIRATVNHGDATNYTYQLSHCWIP